VIVVDSTVTPYNQDHFYTRRTQPAGPAWADVFPHITALLRHNEDVPGISPKIVLAPPETDHRLRKHADYQRVYREGRKNFSVSMSYFYALRGAGSPTPSGPRVGLTAGKVLGKAVERNRIKRRMRDIVRRNAAIVRADVDIVLHPRRSVLTIEFARLESEVVRIFTNIQSTIDKGDAKLTSKASQVTS
jgi:ribonuclease P protein component